MAILSLADAKAAVVADEIASYEVAINAHLETAGTVEFLEDAAQPNPIVILTFPGKVLTPQGIAGLKAAITASGWTAVVVENGFEPPRQGIGSSGAPRRAQVTVTFKPAAATGGDTGGDTGKQTPVVKDGE